MTPLIPVGIELLYMGSNIGLAKWQAYDFDVLQNKIDHKSWAVFFAAITFPLPIIAINNGWIFIWLWFAAIVMHFPVFSIALNKFRKPPRAWDYHNTSDTNGSKWDLWLGKWYDEVLFASVAAWVFLQFLIFFK